MTSEASAACFTRLRSPALLILLSILLCLEAGEEFLVGGLEVGYFLDDPCVVEDRSFTLTTRRDNQETIDIVIIENDSIEDELEYDCTNPLLCKSFILPPHLPKGTEVNFHVQRDKNGIIQTSVECYGNEIQYLSKEIAEDSILKQIKQTINKMKTKEN